VFCFVVEKTIDMSTFFCFNPIQADVISIKLHQLLPHCASRTYRTVLFAHTNTGCVDSVLCYTCMVREYTQDDFGREQNITQLPQFQLRLCLTSCVRLFISDQFQSRLKSI